MKLVAVGEGIGLEWHQVIDWSGAERSYLLLGSL